MRQVHHWTAVVFVAVVVAHLARVFFTGGVPAAAGAQLADRVRAARVRPRGGVHRLLAAGRPAVGDRARGSRTRAAISIPFVGPYLASLAFGGEFPTAAFLPRFFVLHVMLLPALFAGAIAAHVGLVFLQKHTQ